MIKDEEIVIQEQQLEHISSMLKGVIDIFCYSDLPFICKLKVINEVNILLSTRLKESYKNKEAQKSVFDYK